MIETDYVWFAHPQRAYRLEFPAHWEHRVEKEGMTCGFGPRERDDVGIWISIMPDLYDTDQMKDQLPDVFASVLEGEMSSNPRIDTSLQHHAMTADCADEGEGGRYWIVTGGDIVLFISTQVPAAERDAWNFQFQRLMESLTITRDDALLRLQLTHEVFDRLCAAYPEQEYKLEGRHILGRDHRLSVDNIFREVRESPKNRERLIAKFVDAVAPSSFAKYGHETWEQAAHRVYPVLKPRNYIREGTTTERMVFQEWLADIVVTYAIQADDTVRFVTDWDRDRWQIDDERLHSRAMRNLVSLNWPERLEGARQPGGGRLILVLTGDGFSASRLLHPDLHKLMSKPMGSPFYAAVPDRDTLVVFSHHPALRRKIARQVRKDFEKSAYQISPRLFLVTADGIALAEELK